MDRECCAFATPATTPPTQFQNAQEVYGVALCEALFSAVYWSVKQSLRCGAMAPAALEYVGNVRYDTGHTGT